MNTGTTCAALPPPIRTHVSHTVDTVDIVDIVDIVDTQIPDLESQFTNNMTLTIYHHSHYCATYRSLHFIFAFNVPSLRSWCGGVTYTAV